MSDFHAGFRLKGPDTVANVLLGNVFFNDVTTILTANSCPAVPAPTATSALSSSRRTKRFQPIR